MAQFKISLVDECGNQTSEAAPIDLTLTGPAELSAIAHRDAAAEFVVQYTPTVSGVYQSHASIGGKPIRGSPFELVVSPATTMPRLCKAVGVGLERATAGERQLIQLQSFDAYGNRRTSGADRVEMTFRSIASGAAVTVEKSVADNGDGSYHLSYVLLQSGAYSVSILVDGEHIYGSPFYISVGAAAAYAPKCTAVGTAFVDCIAGSAQSFAINMCDRYGNRLVAGGDTLEVHTSGPAALDVAVADQNDGTHLLNFTPATAGEFRIEVRLQGEAVRGSPFGVNAAANLAQWVNVELEKRAKREVKRIRQEIRVARSVQSSVSREAHKLKMMVPQQFEALGQGLGVALRGFSSELEETRSKYQAEIKLRRQLHNQLQELRGNIRVFVRVRPVSAREASKGLAACVQLPKQDAIALSLPDDAGVPAGKPLEFDRVFAPKDAQTSIFDECQPLVTSVLDGYNVCIFAYGQTGAGKTHTMQGSDTDPGISFRAVAELFRIIQHERTDYKYDVSVTLFEIYMENVRDLMVDPATAKDRDGHDLIKYEIRKGDKGMYIDQLKQTAVKCQKDVIEVIERGMVNRAVGQTDMNDYSSRSHMLLTIYVEGTNHATGLKSFGKLHMVDLAGSERLSQSGSTGVRLKEAASINKSLSNLGNVVSALVGQKPHVPYRDSKLTYFLADSIGGDAKTLMVACVSPIDFSQTEQTLKFASRVRSAPQ